MTREAPKKASPEDWHPADILAALHRRGITLRALARAYGFTGSSAFSAAMVRPTYPINEQRLADALEVHPMVIWPSRYNADGTRKPQGARALKNSSAATLRVNVNLSHKRQPHETR